MSQHKVPVEAYVFGADAISKMPAEWRSQFEKLAAEFLAAGSGEPTYFFIEAVATQEEYDQVARAVSEAMAQHASAMPVVGSQPS